MKKIQIRHATKWQDLPDVWKYTPSVKNVKVEPSINSSGLCDVMSLFASEDDMRPALMGINFDSKAITATDAHKMLVLPNSGKERGVYYADNKQKQDLKYPDYEKIVPIEQPYVTKVTCQKLKSFCNAIIKGEYCNSTSNQINFNYLIGGVPTGIGVKVSYFMDMLTALQMLGHEEVYISFSTPNRVIVLSPSEKAVKMPHKHIGKEPIALLMPLMLHGTDEYTAAPVSAQDVDLDTEMLVMYDLYKDEIINADGKVATYTEVTEPSVPYLSDSIMKVLKKITSSNKEPIVQLVEVTANGTLQAMNTLSYVTIEKCGIGSGMYEIVNGALKDIPEDADSFPTFPNGSKFNVLGSFGFAKALPEFLPFTYTTYYSINNVHMHCHDGELAIEAKNQYTALRKVYSAEGTYNFSIEEPVFVSSIMNALLPDMCSVSYDGGNHIRFSEGDISIYTRISSEVFPDIKNEALTVTDFVFHIDAQALGNVLKKAKGKESKGMVIIVPEGGEWMPNGIADVHIMQGNKLVKNLGVVGYMTKEAASETPQSFAYMIGKTNDYNGIYQGIPDLKAILGICGKTLTMRSKGAIHPMKIIDIASNS